MTGRKSSRGAAVVLAGCVGLALVAPGLAVAQDTTTTSADCTSPAVPVGGQCVAPLTTTTTDAPESTVPEAPVSSESSPAPSTNSETSAPAAGTGTATSTGSGGSATSSPGTSTGSGDSGVSTPVGSTASGASSAASAASPAGVAALNTAAAKALSASGVTTAVNPGTVTDLLKLPGLPTTLPVPNADGSFNNVNDQCLAAIGGLQFPAGTTGLDALSTNLQGFCSALDPTAATGLLANLIDLLKKLIPTLPGTGTGTVVGDGTIPTSAPDYAHGYWKKRYDVDCDDLSSDEAQAIFEADRSDPFRLDGDDDGDACEDNATVVNVNNYSGYPMGGVSTGDGTGAGASPAGVALAAMTLSFLALGGVTLVRRFGQDA